MFKIITTGYFYADGGVMFGAIPKVTSSRSYPADNRNMCMLAMHTGVVKTADGHIIVVDPGVGIDRLNESPAVAYLSENTKVLEQAGLLRLVEAPMEPFAGLAGVACGESGRCPRGRQALPAGKPRCGRGKAGVACGGNGGSCGDGGRRGM